MNAYKIMLLPALFFASSLFAATRLHMDPPVENQALIVYTSSFFARKPLNQTYVLDLDGVPETYRDELRYYTVNGLHFLGFNEAPGSPLIVKLITVDNADLLDVTPARPEIALIMIFEENGQLLSKVTSACSGRGGISKFNHWFVAMSAANMYYYDKPQAWKGEKIRRHPEYLQAVSVMQSPKEATENAQ